MTVLHSVSSVDFVTRLKKNLQRQDMLVNPRPMLDNTADQCPPGCIVVTLTEVGACRTKPANVGIV